MRFFSLFFWEGGLISGSPLGEILYGDFFFVFLKYKSMRPLPGCPNGHIRSFITKAIEKFF